jgi:hypothetical protein
MFDLRTSRDFYVMLIEDFDDFMADPHSARRALHCAITAYHLHEWVWGDWLKSDSGVKQTLHIGDLKSFRVWLDSAYPWFSTVQNMTNGTKHFTRGEGFQTLVVRAPPFCLDIVGAGLGKGALGGPLLNEGSANPGSEGRLLIDFGEAAGEHRWLPAAHLLESVVRFWRDFFKKYHSTDIPVSRHHVDYQRQVEAL